MRIKSKLIFLSALFAVQRVLAADGDTFTAMILDDVEITCKVISESDMTCQIGSGYEEHNAGGVSLVIGLTLPSEVNGYKVIKVADYAFAHWWGMFSVIIPEGVTSIGMRAFYGCSGLKSISLPSTLSELGNPNYAYPDVFNGCYNLEEIKVAEGNTTYDSRNNCNAIIQEKWGVTYLLYGCKGTTIPEGVQIIDNEAFEACVPAELHIPSTVTTINSKNSMGVEKITVAEGNKTFDSRNNCNAVIETAKNELIWGCINTVIPEGTERIGNEAFVNVYDLTSVSLPESVRSIGKGNFDGSEWFANQPYGVVYIGKFAYGYKQDYDNYQENITVTIEDGTEYICDGAFEGCYFVSSFIFPSSLKAIGNYAFHGCQALAEVDLPENLTSIGENAFEGCSMLTKVNLNAKLETIGNYAFAYNEGLKSITIPEGIKKIGDHAFYCEELSTINFPKGYIDMKYLAFIGSAWLNEQPDGMVYAGDNLLWYKGHKSMPENTTVTIKDGTIGICSQAFMYTRNSFDDPLSNLVSVTLPNSIEHIGYGAFYGCSNLEIVNIPEDAKIQSIEDYAFNSCGKLSSITLPKNVSMIGIGAFSSSKLSNLTLPEGLESIGDGAFSGCNELTSLIIPENVKAIGESAFANCSSLEEITSLINKPFAIQDNVFQNTTFDYNTYESSTSFSTAILTVPTGTKKLYFSTDGWKNFSVIKEIGADTQKEDVTNDDEVDAKDVVAILNALTSGSYDAKADVNGDGQVNVADILQVVNAILATKE